MWGIGRSKKSDKFLTKRNGNMYNSGRRVFTIKDPESNIVMNLNSKLGIREDTILGRRMASAEARMIGNNSM